MRFNVGPGSFATDFHQMISVCSPRVTSELKGMPTRSASAHPLSAKSCGR
jgi:hypothetical protein